MQLQFQALFLMRDHQCDGPHPPTAIGSCEHVTSLSPMSVFFLYNFFVGHPSSWYNLDHVAHRKLDLPLISAGEHAGFTGCFVSFCGRATRGIMRELFGTSWLRLGERTPLRRRRLHNSDLGGEGQPGPSLGQSSPEDTGGSKLSAVWERRKKTGGGGRASDCRESSTVEESEDAAAWLDGSFKCCWNGKRCLMAEPCHRQIQSRNLVSAPSPSLKNQGGRRKGRIGGEVHIFESMERWRR